MQKTNAFLLIEVLIALGIFSVCALSIALSSTELRVHYINMHKRRAILMHTRNRLERSCNTMCNIAPINSSALATFLRSHGIDNHEPFFYRKETSKVNARHTALTLVGVL